MNISRRDFLKYVLFLSLSGEITWLSSIFSSPLYILRPPGAKKEKKFLKLCMRCGQCIKICPTQVIHPTGKEAGATKIYTPRLIYTRSWCEMCLACQDICPTGAIAKIKKPKIGTAQINKSTCIAWEKKGKHCLICQEVCPYLAISSDKKYRPTVTSSNCVGCGLCEYNCPTSPRSIFVTPLLN